jgi:dimeric dUTPase (all-alpha-NTP-PPase superfamily)
MMNLQKLFELQRKLDEHIEKEHPRQEGEDRLAKKILALQVELGELANEWRGFKYWSHDQEPRTIAERGVCVHCAGTGNAFFDDDEEEWEDCPYCKGEGEEIYNPLLEEYVDCLHFILSIGLELGLAKKFRNYGISFMRRRQNPTKKLSFLIAFVNELNSGSHDEKDEDYEFILDRFFSIGYDLGFTWEQIEEAYLRKNAENHTRQENGY